MLLPTKPFHFSCQRHSQTQTIIIPTYNQVLASQLPTTNKPHTMRVVQTLTEQGAMSFHRALLYTMNSITTYKTMASVEEQVSIVGRKIGQSIKGEAINGHRNRSREGRTFIEHKPVGVMMDGHIQLSYPKTLSKHSTPYTHKSVTDMSLPGHEQTMNQ
jgi:hypothetical protein